MKLQSYILFFLLFGLLPDLYIVLLWPSVAAVLLCLPTLAALVSLILIATGVRYTESLRIFSYLIFLFELPKFVFLLFSAVGRYLLGIPAAPAGGIALAVGAGVSAFFAYLIFYSSRHLKVHALELSFEGLPRPFDGLRVCQLSDLHLGSFGRKAAYVKQIVDTTLALKPDLILFTGDLVNFASEEADPYLPELARLQAPMGVYAIRGNHDYLLHGYNTGEKRIRDMERLLAMEQGLGWQLLLNSHVLLEKGGARIALAGVENISSNPYFQKMGGDLKKALEGLPEGIFTILLSHDPSHWRKDVRPLGSIALTLSGHTHGLKYKTAGIRPSHWKLPHPSGLFDEQGSRLHVSKGLGSAFAFRLGGFPNIDIITLKTLNPNLL